MRKIIVGAQVSIDGVMQAPGAPSEDPTKGFKFGGWAMPYFSQEGREELDRVFTHFDLLLGRARPMKFSRATGPTRMKTLPMVTSRSCSTPSGSTRSRAQVRSIQDGRAQRSCAASPT